MNGVLHVDNVHVSGENNTRAETDRCVPRAYKLASFKELLIIAAMAGCNLPKPSQHVRYPVQFSGDICGGESQCVRSKCFRLYENEWHQHCKH